ncbi:hypothetical protein QUB16_18810 [Microcoleus sp. D3_18a_C4]
MGNIKSVSIGIIPISILFIGVNLRQSLVRGGSEILFFSPQMRADATQINADELELFRLHPP